MRYIADHDFHIHSTLSPCCSDEKQTPENLLHYARKNGFKKICLTNHFWDENVKSEAWWHPDERYECISTALPLPQTEGIDFLFGAEADMDYNFVVGVSEERYDSFDFIIIPTTHLHLTGHTVRTEIQTPEEAARIWLDRLNALMEKSLPWHKTGIAHLTCDHVFENRAPEAIKLLKDNDMYSVFEKCAKKGVGIELNMKTLRLSEEVREIYLRPYQIAKDCGCKFYLGSDSHNSKALEDVKSNFEHIITLLDLKETDKFELCK